MRCGFCKKKCGICVFKCKYCEIDFCSSCRMPEIHKCIKMDECKGEYANNLKAKLMKEKTIADKLVRLE